VRIPLENPIIRELLSSNDGAKYLQQYTPEFVHGQLDFFAGLLGMIIAVTFEEKQPHLLAYHRIMVYIATQWERLQKWHSGPCDTLALVTRNLIELNFWVNRIGDSPAAGQEFMDQEDVEQREIFNDYLSNHTAAQDEEESLSVRSLRILSRDWPTERRVRVERADEYERSLFKDCSKLIHASPWVVNQPCRLHDPYMRRMYIAYCLHFLSRIATKVLSVHPDLRYLTESDEAI